ncbi:hypothetical protein IHN32_10960 [Deinococcus sp. 14RED07]|uniref:hypothetical protein n=1 Tax=Deinococcus sp. 14RED07 TaxID=2745874 RepID=UPI001E2DAC10|nr:hypothetical protein [Deinococcus sp. 14RED07]MCD0176461.1 hypothetical protein [Deinococcus sp. 14RED07]
MLAEAEGLLNFVGIRQVHLMADRGFCDTDLMAWLQHCDWTYRIRIKSTLILSTPDGQRLYKISDVKRQPRGFHHVRLTGRQFGPVDVILGRLMDDPEQ